MYIDKSIAISLFTPNVGWIKIISKITIIIIANEIVRFDDRGRSISSSECLPTDILMT